MHNKEQGRIDLGMKCCGIKWQRRVQLTARRAGKQFTRKVKKKQLMYEKNFAKDEHNITGYSKQAVPKR